MNITLNNILDEYDVAFGETVRFDCPVCKGLNTFSISNTGENLSLIHISEPRDGLLSRMPSSA